MNGNFRLTISSRKNMRDRRITELNQGLKIGDKLIVSGQITVGKVNE